MITKKAKASKNINKTNVCIKQNDINLLEFQAIFIQKKGERFSADEKKKLF